MLLRAGPIPGGDGWAFELKYDGFRAIVSTDGDLRVRSHRGWNMTTAARPTGRRPGAKRGAAEAAWLLLSVDHRGRGI